MDMNRKLAIRSTYFHKWYSKRKLHPDWTIGDKTTHRYCDETMALAAEMERQCEAEIAAIELAEKRAKDRAKVLREWTCSAEPTINQRIDRQITALWRLLCTIPLRLSQAWAMLWQPSSKTHQNSQSLTGAPSPGDA